MKWAIKAPRSAGEASLYLSEATHAGEEERTAPVCHPGHLLEIQTQILETQARLESLVSFTG